MASYFENLNKRKAITGGNIFSPTGIVTQPGGISSLPTPIGGTPAVLTPTGISALPTSTGSQIGGTPSIIQPKQAVTDVGVPAYKTNYQSALEDYERWADYQEALTGRRPSPQATEAMMEGAIKPQLAAAVEEQRIAEERKLKKEEIDKNFLIQSRNLDITEAYNKVMETYYMGQLGLSQDRLKQEIDAAKAAGDAQQIQFWTGLAKELGVWDWAKGGIKNILGLSGSNTPTITDSVTGLKYANYGAPGAGAGGIAAGGTAAGGAALSTAGAYPSYTTGLGVGGSATGAATATGLVTGATALPAAVSAFTPATLAPIGMSTAGAYPSYAAGLSLGGGATTAGAAGTAGAGAGAAGGVGSTLMSVAPYLVPLEILTGMPVTGKFVTGLVKDFGNWFGKSILGISDAPDFSGMDFRPEDYRLPEGTEINKRAIYDAMVAKNGVQFPFEDFDKYIRVWGMTGHPLFGQHVTTDINKMINKPATSRDVLHWRQEFVRKNKRNPTSEETEMAFKNMSGGFFVASIRSNDPYTEAASQMMFTNPEEYLTGYKREVI